MERICKGDSSSINGFICTEEDLKKLMDNAISIALKSIEQSNSTRGDVDDSL